MYGCSAYLSAHRVCGGQGARGNAILCARERSRDGHGLDTVVGSQPRVPAAHGQTIRLPLHTRIPYPMSCRDHKRLKQGRHTGPPYDGPGAQAWRTPLTQMGIPTISMAKSKSRTIRWMTLHCW